MSILKKNEPAFYEEEKSNSENELRNSVRRGKSVSYSLKTIENSYKIVQNEIFRKAEKGEVTLEDVRDTLNALNDVKEASKKMRAFVEKTNSNDDGQLSEKDKEKIYHYYKTNDFTQVQLADIFNTNQPMISRIINDKDKEKNK